MSLKILFERKRRRETSPEFLYPDSPISRARGFLAGSEVIVNDNASMSYLTTGFYGSYLGQRMNFYNTSCFPAPEPSTADLNMETGSEVDTQAIDPGLEWLNSVNVEGQRRIYLCAEEAVYLMKTDQLEVNGKTVSELWDFYVRRDGIAFKRRYLVYEHFRNQGWTVRSAVNFSGDYSLYKENPKTCHSSAIVRIVPDLQSINSVQTVAMRRHLKNVKKALLLVIIKLDSGQIWNSIKYDSAVQFEIHHSQSPQSASKLELFK